MKKLLRIGILLLVVAGLAGGGYYLVQRKQRMLEKVPEYGLKPRPVTVSTAEKGTLTEKRHYLAVVEAGRQADLAPRVTAPTPATASPLVASSTPLASPCCTRASGLSPQRRSATAAPRRSM